MTGINRARELMDSFGEVRSFVDLLDRYHAIAREAGVTGCYFWSYKRGALLTLKEGDIESAATIMGGRGPGFTDRQWRTRCPSRRWRA